MKKLFCSINVILAICIAMFSSANALDEPVIDIQYFELSPSTNGYIWMAYCYAQSSESDWTGDIVANGEVTNEYGDVIGDGSTNAQENAHHVIIADQLPTIAHNNAWLTLSCHSSVDFGPHLGVEHASLSKTIRINNSRNAMSEWTNVLEENQKKILEAFNKDFSEYKKTTVIEYSNMYNCLSQIDEDIKLNAGDHNLNAYESADGTEVYMTKQTVDGTTYLYYFTKDGNTLDPLDTEVKQLVMSADMEDYITSHLIDVEED